MLREVVNLGAQWKYPVELLKLLWTDCTKGRAAYWFGINGLISLRDIYLLAVKVVIHLNFCSGHERSSYCEDCSAMCFGHHSFVTCLLGLLACLSSP